MNGGAGQTPVGVNSVVLSSLNISPADITIPSSQRASETPEQDTGLTTSTALSLEAVETPRGVGGKIPVKEAISNKISPTNANSRDGQTTPNTLIPQIIDLETPIDTAIGVTNREVGETEED